MVRRAFDRAPSDDAIEDLLEAHGVGGRDEGSCGHRGQPLVTAASMPLFRTVGRSARDAGLLLERRFSRRVWTAPGWLG